LNPPPATGRIISRPRLRWLVPGRLAAGEVVEIRPHTFRNFQENDMKRYLMASFALALFTLAGVRLSTVVAAPAAEKDIVDTAVSAGSFKTLAAALGAAKLVDTLKGEGPFTVFAPTDEAFAKLPAGTVESLLKPENKDKLTAVLTYHVVPGKVLAKDVVGLKSAKTVQGSEVKISVVDGAVMIDGAKVLKTDILCKNGVIHVIDSVILPK